MPHTQPAGAPQGFYASNTTKIAHEEVDMTKFSREQLMAMVKLRGIALAETTRMMLDHYFASRPTNALQKFYETYREQLASLDDAEKRVMSGEFERWN